MFKDCVTKTLELIEGQVATAKLRKTVSVSRFHGMRVSS
jgi:hypothetical protein